MRISRLEVSGFRNIASQVVEPGLSLNMVIGANGQGKTNLVEAIVFTSWLKSFRTNRTNDLIAIGGDAARLGLAAEARGSKHDIEVQIGPGWRRAAVDGKTVRSARDTLETLTVVCLGPDDPLCLQGGPEGRRTLVDRLAVLLDPVQAAHLGRFGQLLRERNTLIRLPPDRQDKTHLSACEEALAQAAARVLEGRLKALAAIRARVQDLLTLLAGTEVTVSIRYASAWATRPDPAQGLLEMLRESRPRDALLGYTTVGPQVDDIVVEMAGLLTRGHASRGQNKLLMLAWKAAEAQAVRDSLGEWPVLVLDDALSDLDPMRRAAVLAFLGAYQGQSFVTGTMALSEVPQGATVFLASNGTFERL